jgi:heme/copper-type cytochrome/quinol oxidase subunit 2
MPRNQEPDRNIEDLTDEEICSAIHYLEPHSESAEKHEDGGVLATAIILFILLLGIIAFIWFYR